MIVNIPKMHGWQNYGTTSCGSRGFMEDFLANDSMASIDTRSMDGDDNNNNNNGRIYVGDHKTYIYKLWVSPFQRKRFLSFSHYKSIHMPVIPKTTCNLAPSIPDDACL